MWVCSPASLALLCATVILCLCEKGVKSFCFGVIVFSVHYIQRGMRICCTQVDQSLSLIVAEVLVYF